jgi:hypothetical protein
MSGPKLNEEQIQRFKSQMVECGTPVRFLYRGQCLNIVTGDLQTKGINVIYQWHYWNFTTATAMEIAKALGTDIRAVLSE